jgi:hypothetical protein
MTVAASSSRVPFIHDDNASTRITAFVRTGPCTKGVGMAAGMAQLGLTLNSVKFNTALC